MKNYSAAIAIYRRIYGTDHNRHSAMAIGNLGRVYYNLGEKVKAKECVKCASDILGEVLGTDDPDYEFFLAAQEKLENS